LHIIFKLSTKIKLGIYKFEWWLTKHNSIARAAQRNSRVAVGKVVWPNLYKQLLWGINTQKFDLKKIVWPNPFKGLCPHKFCKENIKLIECSFCCTTYRWLRHPGIGFFVFFFCTLYLSFYDLHTFSNPIKTTLKWLKHP
jgi:hypothetical protein